MAEAPQSQRPYLVRAMHEWMSDGGLTPQLIVDAEAAGMSVPPGYAEDGRIVLNASWSATNDLVLGNEAVEFDARFDGQPFHVIIPIDAILAIFARETREGMLFADEEGLSGEAVELTPDGSEESGQDGGGGDDPPPRGRPTLKVVK